MYDYLVDVIGCSEVERNKQAMTALMLAAQVGDIKMFQHIYTRRVQLAYRYGKIKTYWVPLMEMDVTHEREDADMTSFG